jgi:dihydrodipicolinate synthase/N-acetylneuraminate lyase
MRMLERRTSLTDEELFQAVKSSHAALGGDDLTSTLMRMEITGLITVSSLPKGKRLVQLAEGCRASRYDAHKKRR